MPPRRSFTPPSDGTEVNSLCLTPPPPSQYSLHKRRSRSLSPQDEHEAKRQRNHSDFDFAVEVGDDATDSDVEILKHEVAQDLAVSMPPPSLNTSTSQTLAKPKFTLPPLPVKRERTAVSPPFIGDEDDIPPPPASQIPIDNFFSQRPQFQYDPSQDTMSQFQKMKRDLQPQEVKPEQQRFYDSIAEAFNVTFGTDVANLEGWRRLCGLIGCVDIPDSVDACKAIVSNDKHVNIYDLIEAERIRTPVQVFDTVKALGRYSRKFGKVFPNDNAVSGGFLKFLLRKIGPSGRRRR